MDGDGPQPFVYWIGVICEAFHCLPSEALKEWRRAPADLLEQIIEARAYGKAYAMVEAATTAEARRALPTSDLIDLARRIEFDLAQEAIDRRAANG